MHFVDFTLQSTVKTLIAMTFVHRNIIIYQIRLRQYFNPLSAMCAYWHWWCHNASKKVCITVYFKPLYNFASRISLVRLATSRNPAVYTAVLEIHSFVIKGPVPVYATAGVWWGWVDVIKMCTATQTNKPSFWQVGNKYGNVEIFFNFLVTSPDDDVH